MSSDIPVSFVKSVYIPYHNQDELETASYYEWLKRNSNREAGEPCSLTRIIRKKFYLYYFNFHSTAFERALPLLPSEIIHTWILYAYTDIHSYVVMSHQIYHERAYEWLRYREKWFGRISESTSEPIPIERLLMRIAVAMSDEKTENTFTDVLDHFSDYWGCTYSKLTSEMLETVPHVISAALNITLAGVKNFVNLLLERENKENSK